MSPTVLPPSAAALSNVSMPGRGLEVLGLPVPGCRVCCLCVVSPPLSVYSASKIAKMFAASSCSPSTGTVIEPEQPVCEVIWWPWLSWPRT